MVLFGKINLMSKLLFAREKKKNILIIDWRIPFPDNDSGSQETHNFLVILKDLGHNITFIGSDLYPHEPYTSNLKRLGITTLFFPRVISLSLFLVLEGWMYDIIILSRFGIAKKYIDLVKIFCSRAKILYNSIDLSFLRESRRAYIENRADIDVDNEKLDEMRIIRKSTVTLVVSPFEREILLREDASLNVAVVSNMYRDVHVPQRKFQEKKNIIFIGYFDHLPNIDAIRWFQDEIFPIVKSVIPECSFLVAGQPIHRLGNERKVAGVEFLGHIHEDKLFDFFDSSRLSIAPLRYGAGIKGKLLLSMSYGCPFITTSIGAEGMQFDNQFDACIADTADGFAKKIINMYLNEELWKKTSKASIEYMQECRSRKAALRNVEKLLQTI